MTTEGTATQMAGSQSAAVMQFVRRAVGPVEDPLLGRRELIFAGLIRMSGAAGDGTRSACREIPSRGRRHARADPWTDAPVRVAPATC